MSDIQDILDGNEVEDEVVVEAPEVEATEEVEQADAPEVVAEVEPEVEPEAEAPKTPEAQKMVPLEVVNDLRNKVRELQAAQPAPVQQKAPDVFEDPNGFSKHMSEQVTGAATRTKIEMSKFIAEREFGPELVKEAHAYFDAHPEQSAALLNEPSPYHKAVEIFNQSKVAAEIGNDPKAWMESERARIRGEIQAELAAEAISKGAPSLANETNAGSRSAPPAPTLTSIDDILSG